jgi:hypothetical protein
MGNYSRDSFQDTKNALAELLGLAPPGAPGVRNYVSVRMQQAVPVLDADWNEEGDIRRLELELMVARAVGNGVPASSDGFRISSAGVPNNFTIKGGIVFNNGWLVYNRSDVNYDVQPYRNADGVAPPLPVLQPPAAPATSLVYLDAWEAEVNSQDDGNLVDNRIGVETCVRFERVWVVRMALVADPNNPTAIPTPQPGHRYYPLATVNQPANSQISDGMITDLRRLQLTMDAVTHAPLQMYDPVRDQRLDSLRLALAFQGNLDALKGILNATPEVFVYSNTAATAQALLVLQDVRASATSYQQQAQAVSLYQQAAFAAMQSFFNLQVALFNAITAFASQGLATGATVQTVLSIYSTDLNGASAADPASMTFALQAGDLIGAVMAQERLNQDLGNQTNALPEGNLALTAISVTPQSAVAAGTVYQLTIQILSQLASAAKQEQIDVIASAGAGWTLAFQGNALPEVFVTVPNGQNQSVVLTITAAAGAANTTLNLTARPVRRQQLVAQTSAPLAIGQPILPGTGPIVTFTPGVPLLQGNVYPAKRAVMAATGATVPFRMASLVTTSETYQLTITATTLATGWQAPAQPQLPVLPGNSSQVVNILFKTTDANGALTPVTYQLELVRVTNGASDPQANTIFLLTFNLT